MSTTSTPTLQETASGFRAVYLLTVSDGGGPHAVAVSPHIDGDRVELRDIGRHSLANATARPTVTLLFPAVEPGGYSLIVDARAAVAGEVVELSTTRVVLHRPEPAATQPAEDSEPDQDGACGSDCIPISG